MNEDGVLAVDIKDADLQQRSVAGWPDQHRQLVVHDHAAHRGANRVQHVDIGNAVLTGWRTDPHADNLACLVTSVNDEGYRRRFRGIRHNFARDPLGASIGTLDS